MPRTKKIIKGNPTALPDGTAGYGQGSLDNLYTDTQAHTAAADAAIHVKAQPAPQASFGELVKAAWDQETTVAALMREIGGSSFVPDKNYRFDDKEWSRLTKGIPAEYHSSFLSARSRAEADSKREQIVQELKNQEMLQGAGGLGLATQIGAAVIDPGSWAAASVVGPMAAIGKSSRLSRFFRGGMAGAATNMAIESYLYDAQQTRDAADIAYAGLLGFGFGGLGGLLTPGEARKLTDTANEAITQSELRTIREAGDQGVHLNPEGEQALTPTKAKVMKHTPAVDVVEEVAVHDVVRAVEASKAHAVGGAEQNAMQMAMEKAKEKQQAAQEKDLLAKLEAQSAAQEESIWSRWEADQLAARTKEENLAYAEKDFQDAMGITSGPPKQQLPSMQMAKATPGTPSEVNANGVTTFGTDQAATEKALADEQGASPKATNKEAPKSSPEAPVSQEKAKDDAYRAGDDIILETHDGETIGGRIKSYNPDTGYMVVIDDATQKPRRIDLNEVDVTEVNGNEGFIESGSVGSAQVLPIQKATPFEELSGDQASALTHLRIPFTKFKVPLRWDYYAKFISSPNRTVRRIGQLLLTDPVGNADHAARGLNVSELASLEWHRAKGVFFTKADEAFDRMAKEKGWSWFERQKNAKDWYQEITKSVRDYSTSQFTDPHIGPVVMEIQKIHKELLEKMKKYGVEGAEFVDENPFYMMRRFNHDKLLQLRNRFGAVEMQKLVSGAIRSVRPVTQEQAERIAKQYVTTVSRLSYQDMGRMQLGEAGRSRLRVIAQEAGVDPDLMDEIMHMVLGKPNLEEGSNPRMKNRTMLNENFKMQLKAHDGSVEDVSMSDFFENDSRILMDLYTRQAGGMIGMAKMGIRSDSDWQRMLREAEDEHFNNFGNPEEWKATKKHLEDVYNHILGRPMSSEVYGKQERVLRAVRDLNFIRMMGQVGFAQMAEIGNTLGYAGMRAFSMHMPAFRDVIRSFKAGQFDDQLAKDLVNMAGLGGEAVSMHPLGRHADDMMFDQGLTKIESGLAHGRHAIAHISGLHGMTNMLRQMSSRMFVQKFSDYARNLDKLKSSDWKMMAWSGISKENSGEIFRDLKKYSTVSGKSNKVDGIDWEKWEKASPDTYETFRMAIWRESRRVVQESTIGETAPWMHSTLGKIMTQFRGFMMVAHAKQSLYSIHQRNFAVANAFLASTLFAGLGYAAQTALNHGHDQEAMNERLSLKNLAASAFQRNSASALIPAVVDTLSGFIGYDPIFKFGRTTSLASGALLGNPTVDFVFNKLGGTAQNVTQSFTTDDHMWTKQDVKNAYSMLVPNLMGVKTLLDAYASTYPTSNYLRPYQQ